MAISSDVPIYPISVAARLLEVHPRTLRIYEDEGLITPERKGQKRFFSQDDIDWLQCLRELIHKEGLSIPAIKRLLALTPCWEIKECATEVRDACTAFVDRTTPCWEQTNIACAQTAGQCEKCDVYIAAMVTTHEDLTELARN
ncbi:MAG: MerR family transcriptional regulator [Desulfuromonadales bacterium]|nr:MerR family transcriptional regulator [Desulfuromonadales bacterium]